MKVREFKTSKGEFVIQDIEETELHFYKVFDNPKPKKVSNGVHLIPVGDLKEITEEQASEIVDGIEWMFTDSPSDSIYVYRNYFENSELDGAGTLFSPSNSLNSLIKSLGIHLYENPIRFECTKSNNIDVIIADQNTFYNPYIFRKV